MSTDLLELAREADRYDASVAIGVLLRLAAENGQEINRAEAKRLIFHVRAHGPAAGNGSALAADADEETLPAKNRLCVLTDLEMEARPAPATLIAGHLPARGVAGLYGAPGAGKGLVGLDLCGHVAAGLEWQGNAVQQGRCAWLAAEGSAGLGVRMRAWKDYHGMDGSLPIHFIPERVSIFTVAGLGLLLDALGTLPTPPALVVIDTLAKTILPGDENSTRDMGVFVEQASRIVDAFGCTVLVVHHSNASGERERGNTAFKGDVEVLMALRKDDEVLQLTCEKMREFDDFPPVRLRIRAHGNSAVVVSASEPIALGLHTLTQQQRKVLEVLPLVQRGKGASTTAWKEAASVPARTYYQVRKALIDKGFVYEDGRSWKTTLAGDRALGVQECNAVQEGVQAQGTSVQCTQTPPLGVSALHSLHTPRLADDDYEAEYVEKKAGK